MINPVAKTVEDILSASTQYAIPKYQREFRWGETEAQELLEDLNSYKGDKPEHLFLGNFIFETPQDQITHIVDGQQRITSIMLLLIACRMRAQKLGWSGLQYTIQQKIAFVDPTNAESVGYRLIPSESIREMFEHMASSSWKGDFPPRIDKKPVKRQANRLKPIYEFYKGQIAGFSQDDLTSFLRAIYRSYVVQVMVGNDLEALSIFERTNARGMDLQVSDLLKNYLFAKSVESIEERWKEILTNAEGTILRMLKYFYVSRLGYISKPQLYRKLKEYADKPEVGPETLTTELVEFSRFYSLTKDPTNERTKDYFQSIGMKAIAGNQEKFEAIAASLQALKEFGVVQFCPVAFAAVALARKTETGTPQANAKAVVRLFEAFEKYHFVNSEVCGRVGNEVERLYAETCLELVAAPDLVAAVQAFVTKLHQRLAPWDEFKGRFAEFSYAADSLSILYYIFDRIINAGLQPAQRLRFYIPDPKIQKKSNNIEHFMPRKPPPGLEVDAETRESIDSIGNLLPLHYRTNSRLGNLAPSEKVAKLAGEWKAQVQNIAFVQDFVKRYARKAKAWDAKAIRARAEDLAETAYKKVWALM
jgi:hypothetical protein